MIAGFNTDVEFNGTVYHVQTEDKGAPARQIMSLVYNKGTILASKRASYDDLESVDFSETQIANRVSRQHKLICAAVRAGRIDELKAMAKKGATGANAPAAKTVAPAFPVTSLPTPPPVIDPAPEFNAHSLDPLADAPLIEPIAVIEDEMILPEEAVAVISELAGRERTTHNKLTLELLGETKFKGGDRKTLILMVCRGSDRRVVADAEVLVKIVGSSFRPVIYHARSDDNGLANIAIEVPQFRAGRAALLVRVLHDGEEIELRRAVTVS